MEGVRAVPEAEIPSRAAGNPSPAWAAGPVSTGLGLAAHLAAGGQAPGIPIVAALAALLGMVAAMAGRHRLPGWAVLVAAAVAQQLLHLAFAAFSTASGFTLPGHHGAASIPEGPGAPAAGMPAPDATGATHSLHLMLHLHAAAALAAAAVVTQWTRLLSAVKRRGRSGSERAPGNADA
jgi:hypothetical protein